MTKRDGMDFFEQLMITNRDDPQYARYLVPLPNPAGEEMANGMAEWSYGACADRFCADISEQEADRVWEQCLIDARRMLCEPEYMTIFTDECVPRSTGRGDPTEVA
jgi:hypothetical protein